MKQNLLLTLSVLAAVTVANGQLVIDYQFNDANGTNVNVATNAGTDAGSWNFGSMQVQNGNANFGYTSFFKWTLVDTNPNTDALVNGSNAFRTYTLGTTLTDGAYTFEVDFSKWDLRRNWDANTTGSSKGIGFNLRSADKTATIGFEATGDTGFRAYSGGNAGTSFDQAFGSEWGANPDSLARFEADGGILRITGDLTAGTWTASAANSAGTFVELGSGTDLFSIVDIQFFAKTPVSDNLSGGGTIAGSWGGDGTAADVGPEVGGTQGDYMLIDSITLTAVPEPSTMALYAGVVALGLMVWRRRHQG